MYDKIHYKLKKNKNKNKTEKKIKKKEIPLMNVTLMEIIFSQKLVSVNFFMIWML